MARITTSFLLGAGGPAWAQLPSPSELRQQFQETDRNGDGKIDREEFHRRSVELFYFLDKDRKGYLVLAAIRGLSADDFKAANRRSDGKHTPGDALTANVFHATRRGAMATV
jgi:EF hand